MADRPYGLGSGLWPGLAKLMEEMGELQRVLAKIMASESPAETNKTVEERMTSLIEETGDVLAAVAIFIELNLTDEQAEQITDRLLNKHDKFKTLHEEARG